MAKELSLDWYHGALLALDQSYRVSTPTLQIMWHGSKASWTDHQSINSLIHSLTIIFHSSIHPFIHSFIHSSSRQIHPIFSISYYSKYVLHVVRTSTLYIHSRDHRKYFSCTFCHYKQDTERNFPFSGNQVSRYRIYILYYQSLK